jgi:hypothetical protein
MYARPAVLLSLAVQLSGMIAFSSKGFGMVNMSEGARENVGRKEEILRTIIPTNRRSSFHGHSVMYSVLYCTVILWSERDHQHSRRCVMEGDL